MSKDIVEFHPEKCNTEDVLDDNQVDYKIDEKDNINNDDSEQSSTEEITKRKREIPKRKKEETLNQQKIQHHMTLRSKAKTHNPKPNVILGDNTEEPSSYQQATESWEAIQWLEAMTEEYNSLMEHDSWDFVEAGESVKPVKCRWVYSRKNSDDTQRFKARLVAKGYTQKEGIDYDEVYAPLANFETIRLLLATAVEKGWSIAQFDVESAYLLRNLNDKIYMEQPQSFTQKGKGLVSRLKTFIYGLKQIGRSEMSI